MDGQNTLLGGIRMKRRKGNTVLVAVIGGVCALLILVLGTVWTGRTAARDTEKAVRSVSQLYLEELAGRREQVVASNLNNNIAKIQAAVSLMTPEDLSDAEHLQAFQSRMKKLFSLEKFAFVDTDGLIYTSRGTQDNIADYAFDHVSLAGPEISVLNPESPEKKVVIAVPVGPLSFQGKVLAVCFMEIDMQVMLEGVSMNPDSTGTTFCNIYTAGGIALSNTVLGGLAVEDNLLEAMRHAEMDEGYSPDQVARDFAAGRKGQVSFTYDGIRETLSYAPVAGTDWFLTYLIRESVLSREISAVSDDIITRSLVMSLLTAAVLIALFAYVIHETRKSARLALEKETIQAESRVKQQELEEKLALQEQLASQSQALSDALAEAEQANKAKTAFLSNMSHEIRTPMNAIIGLDSIALNDPDISDRTREYLEKIGTSANHLLALINDILDMSRIESGRMVLKNEEFSFSRLIEQLCTLFSGQCQDKGLSFHCRIIGEMDDDYIGDAMKLRQVLINTLSNAVKFTPEGGEVDFSAERIRRFDGKSTLRFVIRDTGIGMSPEYLPDIFDAFSQEDSSATNKYGSSGLGMAITKNIVTMMNGDIRVESEKGKGTVFTVTVTLMDSDRKGGDAGEIVPADMCVLVVDDDPVACDHARLVLEKVGIASETASSGSEAVEMVRLRHARRAPYNLILVDWQMPEMDGVETTRQIRAVVGRESAVIILTAYRWDEIADEAAAAGVDSFIAKPLFASTVLEEFRAAMKKKSAAASQPENRADLKGRRILLAEDMAVNAEIMTLVLQMREMEVEVAENGRIAVESFEKHPAGYYDAILMDMRMPEMDGIEATERIRAMARADAATIPIIALTANAFDEDVQRSLQAGLNAHLSKPVEPDMLYQTLESLIPETPAALPE